MFQNVQTTRYKDNLSITYMESVGHLIFSYSTLVAFLPWDNTNVYRREYISNTTSKHINYAINLLCYPSKKYNHFEVNAKDLTKAIKPYIGRLGMRYIKKTMGLQTA